MWVLLLSVVFGTWVFFDARAREIHSIGWHWPVLTFILGPVIALPFYFAYRNLKAGEIREGEPAGMSSRILLLSGRCLSFS